MRVLLSIKPEFANKIFSGEKRFEFRRSIFKQSEVKTVVVYASSPIQKVIGEFEIGAIFEDELRTLWKKTSAKAGITKDFFESYFANKEVGFAIKIKKSTLYKVPLCVKKDFGLAPPQSYVYLR